MQVAAGVVGSVPEPGLNVASTRSCRSNAQGRLNNEQEFGDIVVKTGRLTAQVTRLRDVARVELGASEYSLRSLLDNKTAVAMPIFAAARARTRCRLSDNVRKTMAELKKDMPDGRRIQIVYDPTQFVRARRSTR